MKTLIKFLWFIKRGFFTWISYKWMVLMNFLTWIMQVLWLYFLGKLGLNAVEFQRYNVNFFSFIIIGFIFESFSSASIYGFRDALYTEQVEGTLESALMSTTSLSLYAIGQGIWRFCKAGIGTLVIIITSLLLGMKITISLGNILSLIPFFIIAIISLMGLGIASSGISIVIKQGDPLMFAITWGNRLVTGVYYPVSILPSFLQMVSKIFPLTYALDGLRLILFNGYTLFHPEVFKNFIILFLFCIILIPLGLKLFEWGYEKARKEGTLAFF